MGQMYEVVLTATGEVHDAEGNLLSSEPVEIKTVMELTEQEAAELRTGESS